MYGFFLSLPHRNKKRGGQKYDGFFHCVCSKDEKSLVNIQINQSFSNISFEEYALKGQKALKEPQDHSPG